MARSMSILCLAVACLAVFVGSAAAGGKGAIVLTKPSITFTKQCVDVCKDRCKKVPNRVCADVEVPYKECGKVPVTTTVQKCKKVCTTTTTTVTETPIYEKFGKGRHLLGKGKGMIVGPSAVDCKDVCADVPVTTWTVQCDMKTKTVTQCKKFHETVCTPVCRPRCQKVPVVTEQQVVVPVPHVPVPHMSKGKGFMDSGKGFMDSGKGFMGGKGH